MELLFIWIENYRNIENQGFSFSAEYNISFDIKTKTLSIISNSNYIPYFFGKGISNITVIVGENGTGKSSILDLKKTKFYIAKVESSLFLVCEDNKFIKQITTNLTIERSDKLAINDTLIVRYSNHFDGNRTKNYTKTQFDSVLDISTNVLVFQNSKSDNSYEPSPSLTGKRVKMNFLEIEDQIAFVFQSIENHQKLSFKIPEKLIVGFNLRDGFLDIKSQIKNKYSGDSYRELLYVFSKVHLPKHISKKNNRYEAKIINPKKYALFLLRWSMFISFINSFTPPNTDATIIESLLNFMTWKTEPIENWFADFFERTVVSDEEYMGSKYDEQVKAWSKNAVHFVKEFENLLDNEYITIKSAKDSLVVLENFKGEYGIDVFIEVNITSSSMHADLYRTLVTAYNSIIRPDFWRIDSIPFLYFEWRGLSSGEIAMFRLFSRFNSLNSNIKRLREVQSPGYVKASRVNLIILIDEGEIGLHPQWQKQFLNTLIDTFPNMYEREGIQSIQIILATHSPFVLSDVPNSNVIFLEKGEDGMCQVVKNPLQDKKMTFAANIHTLLSDSFFIKDGLIGDFAKKKINTLIDDLISNELLSEERKEEIQKTIPLIGEPIIRRKIMDLYAEKVNLRIEDRVKALEEEINRIKSQMK